jgi:hypothetical protein
MVKTVRAFCLSVGALKSCPPRRNVYVTRHRISSAIKKETKRFESQLEKAALRENEP